jgi:hypothetical protein
MGEQSASGLVREYRREFGSGFRPLRLWRDRRRILAEPALAAQSAPPLSNAPVRFALSLQLIPILTIGWAVSAVVGVLVPDEARQGESASGPIIEVLAARLPGLDDARLDRLGAAASADRLPPGARELAAEARRQLVRSGSPLLLHPAPDDNRAFARAWLRKVDSAALEDGQRRALIARIVLEAKVDARKSRMLQELVRSANEGGPVLQVVGAFNLLLSAWMFAWLFQRDGRFAAAVHADRFFLYYTSSLLFWFLPLGALLYGANSYASAIGNTSMVLRINLAMQIVGIGQLAWLLWHAPEVARALGAEEPSPSRLVLITGWRLLLAYVLSTLALMAAVALLAIARALAMRPL